MMPVTDPSVLAQLNGPTPVTDPAILAQLNQSQPSISDNIGNDWNTRMQSGAKDLAYGVAGQQSMPESLGQAASQVAGGIWDIPTETAKSMWGDTPHNIAEGIDSTSPGQKMGDMLMQGNNSLSAAAEAHPRAARNLEAIAQFLGFEGAGAAGEAAAKPIAPIGDAIYASGKSSSDAARNAYIADLILPKKTPTVKADMALRTTQVDGKNIYNPTQMEANMADAAGSIPDVGKGNSYQKNLNLIQDANSQEAEALKAKLSANDAPIPEDKAIAAMQAIRKNLPQSTAINGPGEAVVEKVINAGTNHLANNSPLTAASMLQARKEFDQQMIKEAGEGVFDTTVENPRKNAIQAVRQSMNNMTAEAVPHLDVLPSLQKQSALFEAAHAIAPKAGAEAATKLGRALQSVTPHSLSGMIAEGAGIMGGGAALHYLPPSAIATALGGYGLYKGATAPATRMAIGKALGGGQ